MASRGAAGQYRIVAAKSERFHRVFYRFRAMAAEADRSAAGVGLHSC